jgi:uncharacterized membrane protein
MTLTLRGAALNGRAISQIRVVYCQTKNLGGKTKMGTSFQYSKTLAIEGSILLILGGIPYVGWVLGIIGIILLMRGIREFANYYQDNQIYENALTGVKFYIIALIAAAVAITSIVVGAASATGFTFKAPFVFTAGFAAGLIALLVGLIIAFVFFVLASTHLRKTFDTLAQKSGEHSFATAASLLWWGSILTIIGIGFILIFVAWIFAVIGFFTMKGPQQETYVSQPNGYTPPLQAPTMQSQRFCPNCGSPVTPNATYCSHCGKQLTS